MLPTVTRILPSSSETALSCGSIRIVVSICSRIAILEQMDTTILIEPQDNAVSDDDGNILVTVGSK